MGGKRSRRILILEVRGGISRTSEREHILSDGGFGLPEETFPTAAQLGMQGSTSNPMLAGFPLINVTSYLSLGYAANEPVQFFVSDIQEGAKMTWINGSHTMKWGVDFSRTRFNQCNGSRYFPWSGRRNRRSRCRSASIRRKRH